jgi:hypothetical protein
VTSSSTGSRRSSEGGCSVALVARKVDLVVATTRIYRVVRRQIDKPASRDGGKPGSIVHRATK